MIDWMVSASVLILAVVVLRRVLRGRVSPRLQYALWALVLVRLLLPVSFGTTRISVLNTVNRPTEAVLTPSVPAPEVDTNSVMPSDEAPQQSAGADLQAAASRPQGTVSQPAAASRGPSLRQVLLAIWAGGAVVLAGLFLWANGRLSRRLRRTREPVAWDGAGVPVYVTAAVETPCLFGLFRPAVYVTPEAAADPAVLRHTVTHERCHRRQGDHIWAVLRCAALCLHWYNPLVWLAAAASRADGELACDAATVRQLGEEQRAAYGRTLIEMTCRKPTALLVTATTMTGGARGLKERITMLVKKPKTAVSVLLLVVLIAAVAVGCTFTGAADTATPEGDAGSADTEGTGTETMEATDGIPAAIWEHAQREVDSMVEFYVELGGDAWKPLSSELNVTEVPLGDAAREIGAHLYRLSYRIRVDEPAAAAESLPVGGVLDEEWITEVTAEGSPYMVVQEDASSPDGWQETHGIIYDRSLELLYNTVDMVEQYGDAYTAAAVEICGSDTAAAVDGSEYLNAVFTQLQNGEAARLVMTVDNGDMVIGDHFGADSDNAALFIGQLAMHTYDCITPGVPNTELPGITILAVDEWRDWTLEFWEGSDRVQLTVNGETYAFAAEAPDPRDAADYPVGTLVRLWYDEAEFQSAGGMNTTMTQELIPDAGQDYLEAARQLCQTRAEAHLHVTNGSKYAYTYVNCTVEPAEERTAAAREAGEIGQDTWAFYVTTVFVPENQRALDWSMAGNTGAYTGSDPDVPDGAWEYGRCGYVTRTAAGWYAEIVGTGW